MIGWILRRVREYECVHEWCDPQKIKRMAGNLVGRCGGHAAADQHQEGLHLSEMPG